jgi:uncharacterized protein (TIGR02117 family)
LKLFKINSLLTAMRALVGWPLLALGLYLLAAVIGSLVPVNDSWRPPKNGISVYLHDNGVHTSLIFQRDIQGYDLGLMVADPQVEPQRITENATDTHLELPVQLPDDRFPGSIRDYPYIMIGWGDTQFYRETPAWADLKAGTALTALVGSGQASMHVDRLRQLPNRRVRKLKLRAAEFSQLVAFVESHFPNNFESKAVAEKGYGSEDRFYPISSIAYQHMTPDLRYSALFTCNNWVSTALKHAGIKTGYWTPLPFGVMWWH